MHDKTIIKREFKDDTVVRLLASSGYTIDGSTVQILLPDVEETQIITRAQYAVMAIILDQYMLENGMAKELSMKWIKWHSGIKDQCTNSILRGGKETDIAFAWSYQKPIDEVPLVKLVKGIMRYVNDYKHDKLNELDYKYISDCFKEDVTPKDLEPELSMVKTIAQMVLNALDEEKYSYQLLEIYGITD